MLLSCGDALIDFLPVRSGDGRDAFAPVVGGSCLNVAIGIARLGAPAGFMGGISTDLFGRMIAEHAQTSQVDLRYAARSSRPTTLAFVRVDGEPQYAFYDEGTAARNWTYRQGSIPFAEIDAIHVGSTTLVDGGAAAQVLAMVEDARRSTTISFDPNCRSNLIGDKAEYVRRMDQFAANADIVRLSDSDFASLYGGSDYAARAEALFAAGAGLVVVTRGARGARAWHRQAGAIEVEAPGVDVVDTVGAGDSFQAGLLFALRAMGGIAARSLARLSADQLKRALAFAAVCAAYTSGRPGLTRLAFPRSAPDRSTPFLAEPSASPQLALR
jgi:fructokinase